MELFFTTFDNVILIASCKMCSHKMTPLMKTNKINDLMCLGNDVTLCKQFSHHMIFSTFNDVIFSASEHDTKDSVNDDHIESCCDKLIKFTNNNGEAVSQMKQKAQKEIPLTKVNGQECCKMHIQSSFLSQCCLPDKVMLVLLLHFLPT